VRAVRTSVSSSQKVDEQCLGQNDFRGPEIERISILAVEEGRMQEEIYPSYRVKGVRLKILNQV